MIKRLFTKLNQEHWKSTAIILCSVAFVFNAFGFIFADIFEEDIEIINLKDYFLISYLTPTKFSLPKNDLGFASSTDIQHERSPPLS